MNRLKLAELTAGVGHSCSESVLGAPFPQWVGPAAGLITVVGVSLHAFGMWDKHRLEAQSHANNPTWVVALYWVCWLLLAVVVVLLLFWDR